MSRSAIQTSPPPVSLPSPPRWLAAVFADVDARTVAGCELRVGDGVAAASTAIADAAELDPTELRGAVAGAYRRLFAAIDLGGVTHVVRAWNFVPDILAPMPGGGDRYMCFNAGRHDAMLERFGRAELPLRVPAATGVGHAGAALTIHLLACGTPGTAIENPRQTPAYRYSPRFGPLPPCFARATRALLPAGPRLLVAGTAAIRGEATRHADDFDAQLRLTLDNLRAVLRTDGGHDGLNRFDSLRAYVPPMADAEAVRRLLPGGVDVEISPVAALCRPDLLIEIEGVAMVDDQETR